MIEIRIQSVIKTKSTSVIMEKIVYFIDGIHAANALLSIQTQIMSACTRLNVTTCLYLSPIIRARSLSTLIAVEDNIDTVAKPTEEALSAEIITSLLMSRSFIWENK